MRTMRLAALLLLAGAGAALGQQAPSEGPKGDAARGEKHFADCVACHALESGIESVGPNLHGLFSRKAGEVANFRYSPSMKRSGIEWTPQALNAFLADPQAAVPANRMPYAGMPDAKDRADLIAYIQKVFK